MAGNQPLPHAGRQRDPRVVQPQRTADPRHHLLLVATPGAQCEDVPKQPEPQIGIFVMGTRIVLRHVFRHKLVKLRDRIVGLGVLQVAGMEILGQSRQAGRVCRQVEQ